MPVFDGLFADDEDNGTILDLLFLLATWHGYAKLWLHTDNTLQMFEAVGHSLCDALRHFAFETSPKYRTKELPMKLNACLRYEKGKGKQRDSSGSQLKKFNLATYKIHCIPDYPSAIWHFGTTDSYSTQTVSYYMYLYKAEIYITIE
jgi:hypothetical protein